MASAVNLNGVECPVIDGVLNCNGNCPTENVVFPNDAGVTSIGESAFVRCFGLTSVTLPEGLINIGSSAFQECSGLTSVVLPSTLISIGYDAFQWCENIAAVIYKGSKPDIDNLPDCNSPCTEGVDLSNCTALETAYRGNCGCGSG